MNREPAAAQGSQCHQPFLPHSTRIRNLVPEVPGIATYTLEFSEPAIRESYRFQPGQFNMLYLPGIGEAAISISSDTEEPDRLQHTIRVVGNVTRALARLDCGDEVLVRGPFGSAWPVAACEGQDLVLAAGGVGLAPLRPVVLQVARQRNKFGKVWLLYGARTPHDLLYSAQFSAWRDAGIEVAVTVDRGDEHWAGHIGVVPQLFSHLRLDAPRTTVMTCGPEVMMRFVAREALARRVPAAQILVSLERNMNCAVGFCGHCQYGPEFLCRDGPVLPYTRVERYLHVEDL